MNNQNLARGLLLLVISLAFGLSSLRYSIGSLGRAGPGLFPLTVSVLLFLIGLSMVVRAFFVERVPLTGHIKNVAIILVSFCGFALISMHINMIVAIVFSVYVSALAGTKYSIVRNAILSAVLIAIAFAFAEFLGMNLPLY
jgi:hypothetical protein